MMATKAMPTRSVFRTLVEMILEPVRALKPPDPTGVADVHVNRVGMTLEPVRALRLLRQIRSDSQGYSHVDRTYDPRVRKGMRELRVGAVVAQPRAGGTSS